MLPAVPPDDTRGGWRVGTVVLYSVAKKTTSEARHECEAPANSCFRRKHLDWDNSQQGCEQVRTSLLHAGFEPTWRSCWLSCVRIVPDCLLLCVEDDRTVGRVEAVVAHQCRLVRRGHRRHSLKRKAAKHMILVRVMSFSDHTKADDKSKKIRVTEVAKCLSSKWCINECPCA